MSDKTIEQRIENAITKRAIYEASPSLRSMISRGRAVEMIHNACNEISKLSRELERERVQYLIGILGEIADGLEPRPALLAKEALKAYEESGK